MFCGEPDGGISYLWPETMCDVCLSYLVSVYLGCNALVVCLKPFINGGQSVQYGDTSQVLKQCTRLCSYQRRTLSVGTLG